MSEGILEPSAPYAACTIASKSRISLARVTASSMRRHHPEIPFFTLIADAPEPYIVESAEPFNTIRFESLDIPDAARLRFRYSEMELSYALTPFLIQYLLDRGFRGVLFLKQETLVLDRLDDLFEKLSAHSVLLTPHFLETPQGRDAVTRELNVLRAGVFNGGVLGFSNCTEARRVLAWWKARTGVACLLALEEGLHYEQRWLDLVPSLAGSCHIVRDPGINVGHWNLLERRVQVRGGRVTACGVPCRIFRFSGYEPWRPHMVTRYNPHLRVESTGAAPVFAEYHRQLMEAGWEQTSRWPYAWNQFDNGTPITAAMRSLYRWLGEETRRFGDPFVTQGADTFYAWLRRFRPWMFDGASQ